METRFLETDKAMSKEIAAQFGEGYLPPLPTITIEAPAAFPGQTVSFYNYRSKKKETTWGKVVQVETYWGTQTMYKHVYKVKPVNKQYSIRVRSVTVIE